MSSRHQKKNHTHKRAMCFSDHEVLSHLLLNIPLSVYWKDRKGVYQGCNEFVLKLAGVSSKEEIIGKTDYQLPWKDQADQISQSDQEVIETGEPRIHEEEGHLPDGSTIYMASTKVPMKDKEGRVVGVLGISLDITERKSMESHLEKALSEVKLASAAKSEFIDNMSHDIRTPMTGILGMLQEVSIATEEMNMKLALVSEGTPIGKLFAQLNDYMRNTQKYADIALESANELLRLSNEILELSQLESKKAEVSIEVFSLFDVIKRNQDLLQSVAMHKHLDFIVQIEDGLPAYLKGACQYLDRILLNLISNALKFTEIGHVKVGVALANSPSTNTYKRGDRVELQITVEDTGIGIPNEAFERIFEHFSRLTSSYQGVYKGSGLGLYTVKRYVEDMGGCITVKSEVGKGSCFTINLPFTVEDRPVSSVAPSTRPLKISAVKSKIPRSAKAEVLIVEDNPTAAIVEQKMLERLSCRVDIARNGAQAIEKASLHAYDLIFMDVGLPDISGLEVTQKIRALSDLKKSRVAIVALTGHGGMDEHQACLNAGMNKVLTKPPNFLALKSLLEHWVCVPRTASPTTPSESDLEELVVIDWEGSLAGCWGDEAVLHSLLSAFSEDLKETQCILSEAYLMKDVKKIRAELHRCLGGIVFLKLPQLEFVVKAFQAILHNEPLDLEAFEKTYGILQNAFQTFWHTYEVL